MKIRINSLIDKKVRYKIYDFDGKNRKLLAKGKFLHSAEKDIQQPDGKLIVRVQRYSYFIIFINAVYIGLVNLFLVPYPASQPMAKWYSLCPFEEIRLLKTDDTVQINYNKSPVKHMVYRNNYPVKNIVTDYLTSTAEYANEYSGRKPVNIVFYIFALIFWVVLVVSVCLLIRFFVFNK